MPGAHRVIAPLVNERFFRIQKLEDFLPMLRLFGFFRQGSSTLFDRLLSGSDIEERGGLMDKYRESIVFSLPEARGDLLADWKARLRQLPTGTA